MQRCAACAACGGPQPDWDRRVAGAPAAIEGGDDVNCGSFYGAHLLQAVRNGAVSQRDLDVAVARLLRQAIELGILDSAADVPWRRLTPDAVDSPAARALALDAARQSIVLLKNRGELLPLDARTLRTVAVIGPNANATQTLLSNYHGDNTLVQRHSLLMALQRVLPDVRYARGCAIDSPDRQGFAAAEQAARSAQVAIVAVGLDGSQEEEGHDRETITLPGVQEELVRAIVATGTPTVVVLINGGQLAIEWIKDNVPAIVEAFYPGELGGDAVADVLLGAYNPAGRLPYTVYPADFVRRSFFNMNLRTDGGITYMFYEGQALWEFGWGLRCAGRGCRTRCAAPRRVTRCARWCALQLHELHVPLAADRYAPAAL